MIHPARGSVAVGTPIASAQVSTSLFAWPGVRWSKGSLRHVAQWLLLATLIGATPATWAKAPGESSAVAAVASSVPPPAVSSSSYFVAASELAHPLRPFEHLPNNAAINVHAAVVTMPDPVETRLGRSFDTELTALVGAFQAKEYVLDGFAFTWRPRSPDGKSTANDTDASRRTLPSVMLFRKDNWRSCKSETDTQGDSDGCESTYYALFLVGETPSFGIHPESFMRAARCAMALDSSNRQEKNSLPEALNQVDCDRIAWKAPTKGVTWSCDANLAVIGPSFSGAMESMASALSKVATQARGHATDAATDAAKGANAKDKVASNSAPEATGARCQGIGHLNILLRSPSASVDSNDQIVQNAYLSELEPFVSLTYTPLAYSVGDQLKRVKRYLESRIHDDEKVVILSEESSFGLGASKLAIPLSSPSPPSSPSPSSSSAEKPQVQFISVQFPPNIAAIRSEHVQLKQEESKQRRSMLPERLLELDLTGVETGVDQPPTYQASLSSRSDELMLYQTFDALQRYATPVAVVIVATDVRDRLFLLSEIRNAFPGALPVVLEQDNLMVHPDYRAMSRGSIIMPAGKSLLCLNASGLDCFSKDDNSEAPPREQAAHRSAGNAPDVSSNDCSQAGNRRFFSFPTDYAANMFRAVVGMICPSDASPNKPSMLVATLAGFQRVDESALDGGDKKNESKVGGNEQTEGKAEDRKRRPRDIPIVADNRMQLQQPVYLSMGIVLGILLVTAIWLVRNGRTPELATLPLSRHAMRWMDMLIAPNGAQASSTQPSEPRISWGWLVPWIAFAAFGIIIAGYKIIVMFPPATPGDTDLAHGTDRWALICLCLTYACFMAFCGVRMRVWNASCLAIAEHVDSSSRLKVRLGHRAYYRASIATALLLLVLVLCVNDYWPSGAHSVWLSVFAGAFVLGSSGFFLVLYLEGLDRWRCMSLELSRTVTAVQTSAKDEKWPTPKLLDERPRSPFNVVMRIDNYNALRRSDLVAWVRQTNVLLGGTVDPSFDKAKLREWQGVLVSQMKLAGTAVRSSASCSVLGATVALMLIQVYPPVYERLQTTAAAILMVLGFAAITYGVLTLEKDYLLGRMFTNDKDQLTLGGALSALWPKLLAMGSILITVFLPDAWDWLNTTVKAINSLR
jgi:hypothetical protein